MLCEDVGVGGPGDEPVLAVSVEVGVAAVVGVDTAEDVDVSSQSSNN